MSNIAEVVQGPDQEGMVRIRLPSGAVFPVHEVEVDYISNITRLYLSENHFVKITDLQDVDRMLMLELMTYRWGNWLSRQKDWWGDTIDPNEIQKSLNAYSTELRQLKKQLGLDKATRDKEKGDDSVSAYIQNLLVRAREFGVMRENQLSKALELFKQLESLVTLYQNSDEIERREMHVTLEDVLDWMTTIAFPEFEAIDAYFREHQQRMWIRKM